MRYKRDIRNWDEKQKECYIYYCFNPKNTEQLMVCRLIFFLVNFFFVLVFIVGESINSHKNLSFFIFLTLLCLFFFFYFRIENSHKKSLYSSIRLSLLNSSTIFLWGISAGVISSLLPMLCFGKFNDLYLLFFIPLVYTYRRFFRLMDPNNNVLK